MELRRRRRFFLVRSVSPLVTPPSNSRVSSRAAPVTRSPEPRSGLTVTLPLARMKRSRTGTVATGATGLAGAPIIPIQGPSGRLPRGKCEDRNTLLEATPAGCLPHRSRGHCARSSDWDRCDVAVQRAVAAAERPASRRRLSPAASPQAARRGSSRPWYARPRPRRSLLNGRSFGSQRQGADGRHLLDSFILRLALGVVSVVRGREGRRPRKIFDEFSPRRCSPILFTRPPRSSIEACRVSGIDPRHSPDGEEHRAFDASSARRVV